MHLAQRLAVLVLAHAVQLEAARPAEQQPAAVEEVGARLGEDAVELDETRVDENRPAGSELDLGALETERILDHRARLRVRVPAARERAQDVARPQPVTVTVERRLPLA